MRDRRGLGAAENGCCGRELVGVEHLGFKDVHMLRRLVRVVEVAQTKVFFGVDAQDLVIVWGDCVLTT